MRILDRYLGRAVIFGTVTALLMLVSLDVFFAFINEMDDVGRNGYTVLRAIYVTLLTTPRRIYDLFPSAVLLGSLLSLGNLAAHSELIVVRAVGIGKTQVILSVLKAGLILMLISVVLGEVVAPESEQRAQNLRRVGESERLTLKTRDGLWAKDGNRFLNVREVFPDLRLGTIRVYEFDDDLRLTRATFANGAFYQNKNWVVQGIRQSVIDEQGVSTRALAQEIWPRLLAPELFDVIVVKPEQMSASTLYRYVGYMNDNALDADRYELAFWTRFTTPLSSLVMLLLAVPFVFATNRAGAAGQRLFIGIVIGVVFYLVNRMLNNLSLVYGLPPTVGAFAPLLIFAAVGAVAIRRVR
ncbi:MAG: LPS export ABC transporter permease LptG [Gammaproteobacteria bacterium]